MLFVTFCVQNSVDVDDKLVIDDKREESEGFYSDFDNL